MIRSFSQLRFTALAAATAAVALGFGACSNKQPTVAPPVVPQDPPAAAEAPQDGGYAVTNRFPRQYRTVAVNVFRNQSYERKLNGELTEALVKEVEATTPYKVTSEGSADTVLRGTIRKVSLRELSKSRSTGLSEEVLYEVVLDWEWVDQRTGKPITARNNFMASALFVPSRPSAEPNEIGRYAAIQTLASDIVANLQDSW